MEWRQKMMRALGSLFPELAARETRALVVEEQPGLPAGEYGFCEHYCEEPDCDCRVVLILVHRHDSAQEWAAIGYGWEPPAFYAQWGRCSIRDARRMSRPLLDRGHEQSPYAPLLLRAFSEIILDDEYKRRLARHYRIFKDGIRILQEVESRALR
jgi:hypothetical protein